MENIDYGYRTHGNRDPFSESQIALLEHLIDSSDAPVTIQELATVVESFSDIPQAGVAVGALESLESLGLVTINSDHTVSYNGI